MHKEGEELERKPFSIFFDFSYEIIQRMYARKKITFNSIFYFSPYHHNVKKYFMLGSFPGASGDVVYSGKSTKENCRKERSFHKHQRHVKRVAHLLFIRTSQQNRKIVIKPSRKKIHTLVVHIARVESKAKENKTYEMSRGKIA